MPSRATALKIRDEGWPVIREIVETVEAQETLIDGFFEKNAETAIGDYLPGAYTHTHTHTHTRAHTHIHTYTHT